MLITVTCPTAVCERCLVDEELRPRDLRIISAPERQPGFSAVDDLGRTWRVIDAERPEGWIAGPSGANDIRKGLCPKCAEEWLAKMREFMPDGDDPSQHFPALAAADDRPHIAKPPASATTQRLVPATPEAKVSATAQRFTSSAVQHNATAVRSSVNPIPSTKSNVSAAFSSKPKSHVAMTAPASAAPIGAPPVAVSTMKAEVVEPSRVAPNSTLPPVAVKESAPPAERIRNEVKVGGSYAGVAASPIAAPMQSSTHVNAKVGPGHVAKTAPTQVGKAAIAHTPSGVLSNTQIPSRSSTPTQVGKSAVPHTSSGVQPNMQIPNRVVAVDNLLNNAQPPVKVLDDRGEVEGEDKAFVPVLPIRPLKPERVLVENANEPVEPSGPEAA